MSKQQGRTYEERLQTFADSHPLLIEKYDNIEGVIPFDYSTEDIINSYEKLKKVTHNTDFIDSVKRAINNSVLYGISIVDSYEALIGGSIIDELSSNSIQQYFKEINNIYTKNDNNYDIEYCEENRDKLIEMNLKMVISIAKKYQGLGLSLEELISAGNLGLIMAFDKFDPSRSKLKDDALDAIVELGDEIPFDVLSDTLKPFFTYGDTKHKFTDKFHEGEVYTKKEVMKWINSQHHVRREK